MYKDVKQIVEQVDPRESLKILKDLETQAAEIRNPTGWFRSKMLNVGVELPPKVKQTITWFNNHGNLAAPIQYSEVRKNLSKLSQFDQLKILKGLEGKEDKIKDPTTWLCAAAGRKEPTADLQQPYSPAQRTTPQKPRWPGSKPKTSTGWGSKGDAGSTGAGSSLDMKVKKTIGWYNRSGLLQHEIRFDEVAETLNAVGVKEALAILKGLETKGRQIRNPSAWIVKAAQSLN